MLLALHQRNIFPAEEMLQQIERDTKHEFDQLMESHAAVDHGFWYIFYTRLRNDLRIMDDTLLADLVARTRMSANWCDIRPGTRDALLSLRQRHRLGVISNADGKIADVLARCGIADCFESITDSGNVGHEKPHPAIFEAALREMKADAAESLYVGDVYSVDYVGARQAGMQAILFDVAGAYREREFPRVESLADLENWLKQ